MEENLQIKPQIKQMEKGAMLTFPLENINVVRVYCSDLGTTLNRRYKTRKSLDGKVVEVIRLA
jgi:hypothetical protein